MIIVIINRFVVVKNEERARTFCVFVMYELCDPMNLFKTPL